MKNHNWAISSLPDGGTILYTVYKEDVWVESDQFTAVVLVAAAEAGVVSDILVMREKEIPILNLSDFLRKVQGCDENLGVLVRLDKILRDGYAEIAHLDTMGNESMN